MSCSEVFLFFLDLMGVLRLSLLEFLLLLVGFDHDSLYVHIYLPL